MSGGFAPDTSPEAGTFLRPDGTPFGELTDLRSDLSDLDSSERVALRNAISDLVANCDSSRVLVVAGPGSGKSFMFLARIRAWLDRFPGSQVYVSTFVRKLVHDLEKDVAKDPQAAEHGDIIDVTTLHRLARSILERSGGIKKQPLRAHVAIADQRWIKVVWSDVLGFHRDLDETVYGLDASTNQFHTEEFDRSHEWSAVRRTFRTLSSFYNAVGFADSIVLARVALEEQPNLLAHTLWIVDEFQDFNVAEDHLLRVAMRRFESILIAGDDDQALYQTLKASHPEILGGYYADADFANAMLPFCGRCSRFIAQAAGEFIQKHRAEGAIDKIYLPLKSDGEAEKIQVIATATPTGAVDYIRQLLDDHSADLEAHKSKMEAGEEKDPFLLILSPSDVHKYYPGKVAAELDNLIAEHAVVRPDLCGDYRRLAIYCGAAWHEGDNFAWRKVLEIEGIAPDLVHAYLEEALTREMTLYAVLAAQDADLIQRVKAIGDLVDNEPDPATLVGQLSDLMTIRSKDDLTEDLALHPLGHHGDEFELEEVETSGEANAVQMLTMVGSKGLSAHHVVILGCDDVNMSYTTALAFFVAVTRARESLHLVTAIGASGAQGPHPFVLDLPQDCCEYGTYKKGGHELTQVTRNAFTQQFAVWNRARSRR